MIILIVALLLFFVIIILKLQGQKKVGFFAGRLVRPVDANLTAAKQESDINENEDEQPLNEEVVNEAVPVSSTTTTQYRNANTNEKFNQRVWAVRLMFVLSGCFVIIAGGLFYGKGVVSFKNSIDDVRVGIGLVQDVNGQNRIMMHLHYWIEVNTPTNKRYLGIESSHVEWLLLLGFLWSLHIWVILVTHTAFIGVFIQIILGSTFTTLPHIDGRSCYSS